VLGPSLVAFVLTFVLDDTESGRVDAALREDAESRIDQVGIGANPVRTVYQIKSDRLRGIRDKLGGGCLAWLEEKVPGTHAAADEYGTPLCSLVTLAEGEPFRTSAEYLRLLGLHNSYLAVKFTYPDYLFMTPPIGQMRTTEFTATFNEAEALHAGGLPGLSMTPELLHQAILSCMIVEALEAGLRSKYFRCSGRCLRGGWGWSSGRFRWPERALVPVSGYRQ
jgi:hypothetical protein